jgi:hypothetical protein
MSRPLATLTAALALARSSATGKEVPPPGVRARAVAAFHAALCGDALALGGHYEYDAATIAARVGRYERFHAPGEGLGGSTHGVGWGRANYHPGKVAGDMTDAGDVASRRGRRCQTHRPPSRRLCCAAFDQACPYLAAALIPQCKCPCCCCKITATVRLQHSGCLSGDGHRPDERQAPRFLHPQTGP